MTNQNKEKRLADLASKRNNQPITETLTETIEDDSVVHIFELNRKNSRLSKIEYFFFNWHHCLIGFLVDFSNARTAKEYTYYLLAHRNGE